MQIRFVGGPYDGVTVPAPRCRRVAPPIIVVTEDLVRRLIRVPCVRDWPRFLDGLSSFQDSESSFWYALADGPGSCGGGSDGKDFLEAIYDENFAGPADPPTCGNRDLSSRLSLVRAELYGEAGGDELAWSMGVHARTWANYEAGVVVPGSILLAFLVLTSVEPGWLLTGAGPRYCISARDDRPDPSAPRGAV